MTTGLSGCRSRAALRTANPSSPGMARSEITMSNFVLMIWRIAADPSTAAVTTKSKCRRSLASVDSIESSSSTTKADRPRNEMFFIGHPFLESSGNRAFPTRPVFWTLGSETEIGNVPVSRTWPSVLHLVPNMPELTIQGTEGSHDVGVQMSPAGFLDHPARIFVTERRPIATIRRQCVVEIGNGDDACCKRDFRALELVRVAGTVPFLVMRPRHLYAHAQEPVVRVLFEHRGERAGANRAVLLHLHELLRSQLSRFQQDGVGNTDLPDVV